jgi:hypothetical protein
MITAYERARGGFDRVVTLSQRIGYRGAATATGLVGKISTELEVETRISAIAPRRTPPKKLKTPNDAETSEPDTRNARS